MLLSWIVDLFSQTHFRIVYGLFKVLYSARNVQTYWISAKYGAGLLECMRESIFPPNFPDTFKYLKILAP